MEWVFIVAVVAVLGAKVWLARRGHRHSAQQDRRHRDAGGQSRKAPDHLPGRGTLDSGG